MGKPEHWTCPYCSHDAILRDGDRDFGTKVLSPESALGRMTLAWYYGVCANPKCRRYTLRVAVFETIIEQGNWVTKGPVGMWDLIPPSRAKAFPDYIPKPILEDYNEACLIVDLSPKASATLSRRCLQGIIRDYWTVKPGRLVDEIEAIKDKVDPDTWEAIDSVRRVGNIGAHMEAVINLIVDVEPNEAALLIGLIENLLKDWYVAREERKNRLQQIKSMADQKDAARKDPSAGQ